MKRFLIFIISLFLFSVNSFSQNIKVEDEKGDIVPNLFFKMQYGEEFISSNTEGLIVLSDCSLVDSTSFILVSDFYVAEPFTLGSIKSKGKIVVRYKNLFLSELVVMPQERIKEIVKRAALDFGKKYIEDYMALLDYKRFIYLGESYSQIYLTTGFWYSVNFTQRVPRYHWFDPNPMSLYLPMDSFVSSFYLPGNNVPMTTYRMNVTESYNHSYSANFNFILLSRKRALELYSPLNPKMINNYTYYIEKSVEGSEGTSYIIRFSTIYGTFPKKTRLYGSGRIYISEKGSITQVDIENMEERYSNYFNIKRKTPLALITPYTFSVYYGDSKDGYYTKRVVQDVRWVLPSGVTIEDCNKRRTFHAEYPPYRFPFKNRVRTYTEIIFDYPIVIDKKLGNTIAKRDYPGLFLLKGTNLYIPDINKDFWLKKLQQLPDYEKIKKDLHDSEVPLYEQAVKSSERRFIRYDGKQPEENTTYQKMRELYKELFNKEYYE